MTDDWLRRFLRDFLLMGVLEVLLQCKQITMQSGGIIFWSAAFAVHDLSLKESPRQRMRPRERIHVRMKADYAAHTPQHCIHG